MAARDAAAAHAQRFAGLYEIRPAYNPLGPFDLAGGYDERSDRPFTLRELMGRGYEDAYRQFIEPVVGASGEGVGAPPVQSAADDLDLRPARDRCALTRPRGRSAMGGQGGVMSDVPMRPATRVIHLAEGQSREARPLTTPIYETTTFLLNQQKSYLPLDEVIHGLSADALRSDYDCDYIRVKP